MKTIVFVRDLPYAREYKEALGLKRTNKYKLILLHKGMDQDTLRICNGAFDKIIFYPAVDFQKYRLKKILRKSLIEWINDKIKLPYIIKSLKPDLFHCLVGALDPAVSVMKYAKCHVILDGQDFGGTHKGIENMAKRDRIKEKYCLEHANGIIHKGPEFHLDYFREHGYEINCPELIYLDYCNEDFFVNENIEKLSSVDGEWHIGSAIGGIVPYVVDTAKKLANQKIHFHIHFPPGRTNPTIFEKLIKLSETNKYVHFEKPIPLGKVSQVIAKYDFGWNVMVKDFYAHLLPMYPKIAHGNRIADYLEAGLPIICSDHYEWIKKSIEKYNVCIPVKDEEIDSLHKLIDKYDYEELKKNVLKARKKFSINNNIKRLEKFYEIVLQSGKRM